MAEKIIIHIGTHKTGSTAIQKCLFDARGTVTERVRYPEAGLQYYGHHKLAEVLEGRPWFELDAAIAFYKSLEGILVLSSENFSRLPKAAIERFATQLNGEEVEVVLYLRNILDMPLVWWQELVKHGTKDTFLSFFSECMLRPFAQHILNVNGIIEKWAEAFGQESVKIFVYDKVSNTVDHFMQTILGDGDFRSDESLKTVNKSFDALSTEVIRFINTNGYRGVKLFQESSEIRDQARKLLNHEAEARRALNVDFNCFTFRHIEGQLEQNWAGLIQNRDNGPIFSKRTSRLEFIDPLIWSLDPFLTRDMVATIRREGEWLGVATGK